MAWLEAVSRGEPTLDEGLRSGLLEAAHRAAPGMPIASFLAERSARRAGDVESVLRWIRERRSATSASPDPVQGAIDDVVEALLVADKDPPLATERLAGAHHGRPEDLALRELYERVAVDPPPDARLLAGARAPRRPRRRRRRPGFFLEAAHEHERAGDIAAALRDAAAAHAEGGDAGSPRLALERAEIESGLRRAPRGRLLAPRPLHRRRSRPA